MPPPKGSKFNIGPVVKKFKRFYERLRTDFVHRELDVELYPKLFHEIQCNMLYKDKPVLIRDLDFNSAIPKAREELYATLLAPFINMSLDRETLSNLCWRLAACHDNLERHEGVEGSFRQVEEQWVPLQILESVYTKPSAKTGAAQLNITFRVMSGQFGGLKFNQVIPYKYVVGKLAKEIGCAIYKPVHHLEIIGMWFVAMLSTDDPQFPRINEIHAPSNAISCNRKLRAERRKPCHNGYNHACHACPIGYLIKDGCNLNCYRATHPRTFIKRFCEECKTEAFFDPVSRSSRCVSCITKILKQGAIVT